MSFWDRWVRQPQSLGWRRALFQVHLWTGIGTGLYVVAIGVSGSAMVFRPEVYDRYWQTPAVVVTGDRLSEEALGAAGGRAYPGYAVTRVIGGIDPERAVEVWLERDGTQRKRWFDPYTGADLGEAIPGVIKIFIWLLDFHDNLRGGPTGRTVNGVGGLFLTVLCLTGALIWWPGIQTWRRSVLVPRSRNWRVVNWSLHSTAGFWTFAVIFIWAASGFYLVFQSPFQAIVDYLEPFDPESFDPRLGDTILAWVARLHFGRFAGLPVKILWTVLGLALPLLFITGVLMWWNRVVALRRSR